MMDQRQSMIEQAPNKKSDIGFIMFELKGRPNLTALLSEFQALTGEPARLALANPGCGLAVEGAGGDVMRRSDIQVNLLYLTSEVDSAGWGVL